MASTSNDGTTPPPYGKANAASDLDLLGRASSVAEVDQFLDFGPWWYAPLFATQISGMMMFKEVNGFALSVVMGLAALAAALFMGIHDYQRRTVRLRLTLQSYVFGTVMFFIICVMIGAWGTAISSIDHDRFFPTFAVLGWVLTTLLLLGIRYAMLVIRGRRAPLQ